AGRSCSRAYCSLSAPPWSGPCVCAFIWQAPLTVQVLPPRPQDSIESTTPCHFRPTVLISFQTRRLKQAGKGTPTDWTQDRVKRKPAMTGLQRALLQSSLQQGVLVLTITDPYLHGDVLADGLRNGLLAAIARAGASRVVLDFQPVLALSKPAFRPLLRLRRAL